MAKNNIYSFHKTVLGYMHEKKELRCEDASDSVTGDNDLFHIAVVADGHGSPTCVRSHLGSKMAAEIATEELDCFAASLLYNRADETFPEDKEAGIKKLTDTIVFRWKEEVFEHLLANPFTEEELVLADYYAQEYRQYQKIEHAYGTTLIAALQVGDDLILIQQGDGRCDVFYQDGSVDQPIPWDENCQDNVTTSMCDFDASEEIRHVVLNWKEQGVVACYLGTDGVEDSYRDMEGTHVFYQKLSCYLVENGMENFESYLEHVLPEFSKRGSGDDVSVSGIVDLDEIVKLNQFYEREIEKYDVSNLMQQYASKGISMKRKYNILKQKEEDAKRACEQEKENCKQYLQKWKESRKKYQKLSSEFQEYHAKYQEIHEKCEKAAKRLEELNEQQKKEKTKLAKE